MSYSLGFLIEATVAILLVISIAYSIILERRLKSLRLGEDELRKIIAELGMATERAGSAVVALRGALEDCDAELADQLRSAERRSAELKAQVAAGGDILARISRIVGVGDGKLAA